MSLDVQSASSADISEALSAQLGRPVGFVNSGPEDMLTIQAVDFPVDELIDWLQRFGSVAVGDSATAAPSLGPADLLDRRVSLQASDASPQTLLDLLSGVAGAEVRFVPRDPELRLSLDVKDATVGEVLRMLQRYGTVEIP